MWWRQRDRAVGRGRRGRNSVEPRATAGSPEKPDGYLVNLLKQGLCREIGLGNNPKS